MGKEKREGKGREEQKKGKGPRKGREGAERR